MVHLSNPPLMPLIDTARLTAHVQTSPGCKATVSVACAHATSGVQPWPHSFNGLYGAHPRWVIDTLFACTAQALAASCANSRWMERTERWQRHSSGAAAGRRLWRHYPHAVMACGVLASDGLAVPPRKLTFWNGGQGHVRGVSGTGSPPTLRRIGCWRMEKMRLIHRAHTTDWSHGKSNSANTTGWCVCQTIRTRLCCPVVGRRGRRTRFFG